VEEFGMQLQPIDRIMVICDGIEYHGIYIGYRVMKYRLEPCVIHNNQEGSVEIVTLDVFSRGLPVQIVSRVNDPYFQRQAPARAKTLS
jgi:hypothetical protein